MKDLGNLLHWARVYNLKITRTCGQAHLFSLKIRVINLILLDIFGAFWIFSAWIWAEFAPICSKRHLRHDSIPFFPLAQHFTTFCSGMQKNQNFEIFWMNKVTLDFSCLFFFHLSFFSFCYLFLALTDLLLVLLQVGKCPTNHHQDRQFLQWSSHRKFFFETSLKFLSIFTHISGFIEPITLIWVSLERSFSPADCEYRLCPFWSKVMTSEVKKRLMFVTASFGCSRSQS